MFSKKTVSSLYLLFLVSVREIAAIHKSLPETQPDISKFLEHLPQSLPIRLPNNNCNIYNGEFRTAYLALYSNTPPPTIMSTEFPTVENCKFFTGNEFRACKQVHMLETNNMYRSRFSNLGSCNRFTGQKSRFCSEMPAGYLTSEHCKDCKGEKVRFCLDIYKPSSTTSTTTEESNTDGKIIKFQGPISATTASSTSRKASPTSVGVKIERIRQRTNVHH